MKNPAIFYGVIALGVIALAIGAYYLFGSSAHHLRGYTALGGGAVLLIAGVIGMFMVRPKVAAK